MSSNDQDPVNAERLDEVLSNGLNWGRWGDDDELGALNLITNKKRLDACQKTVRSGRTISLSRPLPKAPSAHYMKVAQHHLTTASKEGQKGVGVARDYYGLEIHGPAVTHIDALCHMWGEDGMWNGRNPEAHLRSDGATWGGIDRWRQGIVTRAVLIDVPAFRGEDYVAFDRPVHGSELRQIMRQQNIACAPGDALLVYSGRGSYDRENTAWGTPGTSRPGLHASCLPMIRESDCAVLVWDMMDLRPSGHDGPTVHGALYSYGVALLDNAYLDELAQVCRSEQRYEVTLVVAPLVIPGASGSPVNPIAIL